MKVQVILTVLSTLFETILYSGVLYGWPSLQPILIKEGYFFETCQNQTIKGVECSEQTDSLSLVYTISLASSNILNFLLGFLMDRVGIWFTRTLMLMMIGGGFLLVAIAKPLVNSFLLYIAFSLLSVGGLGLLVTNFGIVGLCPNYRGTLSGLISGSMGSSSIVLLIVAAIYSLGIELSHIFYFLALISLIFQIRTFILMPKRTVPFILPTGYRYGYKELSCYTPKQISQDTSQTNEAAYTQPSMSPKSSLKTPLKKLFFWSNVYFLSINLLVMLYFVGNFNSWIKTKIDDKETINTYTTVFGILLSTGILFSPVGGTIIDFSFKRFRKTLDTNLASMKAVAVAQTFCSFCLIFSMVFSLIPNTEVQWLTFILIIFVRSLGFATTASLLNLCLPVEHFGSLYSITSTICGGIIFLNHPIRLLTHYVLNDNYTITYSGFLFLSVCSLIHPIYLFKIVRNKAETVAELPVGEI